MQLFAVDGTGLFLQLAFIIINMCIYAFIIFQRNGIIIVNRTEGIKIKFWFPVVLFFMVILAYVMLMSVLVPGEKVSNNYAQSRLIAICKDTDKDPQELFDKICQNNGQDDEEESIDRVQYLKFVYANLYSEMVEKNILSEKDESLSFEQLEGWNDNLPPDFYNISSSS